jgi:predicted permease
MQNFVGDIVYAVRQFRRSPVFTGTVILTLALGIGGTTAIYSLIHAVMLRSLPVADAGSLYRIGDGGDCCVEGGPQNNWGMYSFALFRRLKEAAPEFEELAAFQAGGGRFSVRRAGVDNVGRSMRAEYVTGNYFAVFGLRSFGGRLFTPADDRASSAPVAVLSYRAWQSDWGGDASVIGSTAVIEGHPFTIVGVSPPGFFGETLRSDPPDIWVPLQQEPLIAGSSGALLNQSISAWLRVIGRLRPGATTTGMSARLTGVLRTWMVNESGYPAVWMAQIRLLAPKQTLNVVPGGSGVTEMKEQYGRSLQILLAICGLVLLIACANVANLMMARGLARRAQTSIRLAIGASRSRIVSQSLTESVLLAVGGGIAGLGVAYGAQQILFALAFHGARVIPISASPSLPILGFAFALSLLTGIVFGAVPAWLAAHRDPIEALRGSNRSTSDSTSLPRRALLVVQATLSVVLVAGAAMLTRSLGNLEHRDFGYRAPEIVNVSLNSPPASYTPERLDALYRDLLDRMGRLPGVHGASLAMYAPLTDNWGELIMVEGRPQPEFNQDAGASWDRVSAGYFETIGQRVVRGRSFSEADGPHSPNVAVVNEAFVRRFFPKENPLDKHFGIDLPENASKYRIVGVVRDAIYSQAKQPPRPMFFVPLTQTVIYEEPLLQRVEMRSHFMSSALLATTVKPGALEPVLRKLFADADPNLTINSVRTMQEQISLEFDQERAVAGLAGLFGIVALILAAIGLYGVTAYAVVQRTGEIGLRMALGADGSNVVRLVLRGAFNMVAIGLVLGIPLSIGAGRLIATQLYGVSSWDPAAISVAIGSLALAAFIAALIPGVRAASIDPITALRMD